MTEVPLNPIGPPMMCDTCGCRLNNHEQWKDGTLVKMSWEHTGLEVEGTEPHEPVPVLLEIDKNPRVGFCDFCNAQDPAWCYPAGPFKIEVTAETGWASPDNWAACVDCKDDIEAGGWEAVRSRYLSHKAVPKHLRGAIRKDIETLHRAFRLSRLGPAYRIR